MKGTLTATYQGKTKRCFVSGCDSLELTMAAISKIMNKAMDSKAWAKGRIVLKNERGQILHEMEAKED